MDRPAELDGMSFDDLVAWLRAPEQEAWPSTLTRDDVMRAAAATLARMAAETVHTTFEPDANAAYIALRTPLRPGESHATIGPITVPHGELVLDLAEDGRLLGIGVLGTSATFRREVTDRAEWI